MEPLREVQGVEYEFFDIDARDEMALMVAEAFSRYEPTAVNSTSISRASRSRRATGDGEWAWKRFGTVTSPQAGFPAPVDSPVACPIHLYAKGVRGGVGF